MQWSSEEVVFGYSFIGLDWSLYSWYPKEKEARWSAHPPLVYPRHDTIHPLAQANKSQEAQTEDSQKHGSVWTQRLLHDPVFPLGEPSRSSVLSSLFIFCMHGSAPLATRSPERALFCMGRAPPGLIGLLTPSDRPTGGGKAQAQAQARHGASQR
jgi:hypothetical protein